MVHLLIFLLKLNDSVVELQIRVQLVSKLVSQRVLRALPVKRIFLSVKPVNLVQCLVKTSFHGLSLLLVAANLLQISKCLKLFELFLVALQLRLEPLPAKLTDRDRESGRDRKEEK